MLNRIIIAGFLLVISISTRAQQEKVGKNTKCGCAFNSINQVGLVMGEKEEAFQLQTVNGLRYKTWMVGIGTGIDGYRYRSIPLFFQLRKEFNLRTNAIFIYNDIGLNYPWLKSDQKAWNAGDYKEGVYYDGGLGYKLRLRNQALVFSSGFSLKEFSENRSTFDCPFVGFCKENKDLYKYSLKRLSFKIGVHL